MAPAIPKESKVRIFTSMWLDRCAGNCTDLKEVRGVSGSHHPRNLKCMRLPDFLRELDAFFDWYIHEKLGCAASPFVIREEGLKRFPFSGVVATYDDAFVIATAVDYGDLSIDVSRGIKIKDEHYWHPELRAFSTSGNVPVRIEPEDHTCIYVKLGGHWVTAKSARHSTLLVESEVSRIAESLLVMDSKEQRKEATQDSDEALVRLWKESDDRFSSSTTKPGDRAEKVPATETEDVWSMIESSAAVGLAVSEWRSAA